MYTHTGGGSTARDAVGVGHVDGRVLVRWMFGTLDCRFLERLDRRFGTLNCRFGTLD
jgi:hypothetical protein